VRLEKIVFGWPVLGDSLYGNPTRVKTRRLPNNMKAHLLAFPRQALHAAELGFDHPTTGKRMALKTEMPRDLRGSGGYAQDCMQEIWDAVRINMFDQHIV